MGVRRAGEAKRAFAPSLEIWIKNQIFLETPEVGILILINRFDSCNESFFACMKLTLHKSQVHSYRVISVMSLQFTHFPPLPAEVRCKSHEQVVLLLVFIA